MQRIELIENSFSLLLVEILEIIQFGNNKIYLHKITKYYSYNFKEVLTNEVRENRKKQIIRKKKLTIINN
jgi:hypothetical protein